MKLYLDALENFAPSTSRVSCTSLTPNPAGFLIFCVLAAQFLFLQFSSSASTPQAIYQKWPFSSEEAKHRQEEAAKALGIPSQMSVQVDDGVRIEFVLIPAGTFIMGSPELPREPELEGIDGRIFQSQAILGVGSIVVFIIILFVIIVAIRRRRYPQISLLGLVLTILALSVCSWGWVQWQQGEDQKTEVQMIYKDAKDRHQFYAGWEKPAHRVTISQSFYLSKYEITQAQYQAVMAKNPSSFQGDTLPVDGVSFESAMAFCEKVGEHARLPTEAEWEYACRAGTNTEYYNGNEDDDMSSVGWNYQNSDGTTHPVGGKNPNAFGLYDMHGNVSEWCMDLERMEYRGPGIYNPKIVKRTYTNDFTSSTYIDGIKDPLGIQGTERVDRGGGWEDNAWTSRSAYRNAEGPFWRSLGIRVYLVAQKR